MIHSFSCKNFYSFNDLTTVSFVVNEKTPKNNGYFTAPSGVRLSKVGTVIGHNASGKTNLLKVLPFIKWLIIDSSNIDPDGYLPVKSFMFNERKDNPIELSTDFEIDGDIFTYNVVMEEKKIISEELTVKNKTKQKTTSKNIFSRKWNDDSGKYDLKDKSFNLPNGFEIRPNASIISVAVRLGHKESSKFFNYWKNIETNVIEAGWIGDHLSSNVVRQLMGVLNFYSDDKNKEIKEEAEKLLSRFDLGLKSFEIEKEKKEDGFTVKVKVPHTFNGRTEYLPIQYESSGTRQLFILLKSILVVLANGGIAVFDEFDVNLHPEIVLALYELFIHPETNPNNAQLFFSTHSHLILNELDKYQIILTEKNDKGESEAWRLDDVSGIRADENYYAKYIAGAYGAVPML